MESIGLREAYMKKASTHDFCRLLMALPLLPAEYIRPQFDKLRNSSLPPALERLVNYIEQQWINNSVFTVESWSVFMQPIRTNNDVEGWHHRMNTTGSPKNMYRLIELLYA